MPGQRFFRTARALTNHNENNILDLCLADAVSRIGSRFDSAQLTLRAELSGCPVYCSMIKRGNRGPGWASGFLAAGAAAVAAVAVGKTVPAAEMSPQMEAQPEVAPNYPYENLALRSQGRGARWAPAVNGECGILQDIKQGRSCGRLRWILGHTLIILQRRSRRIRHHGLSRKQRFTRERAGHGGTRKPTDYQTL
jgi:hypothetical protein